LLKKINLPFKRKNQKVMIEIREKKKRRERKRK